MREEHERSTRGAREAHVWCTGSGKGDARAVARESGERER